MVPKLKIHHLCIITYSNVTDGPERRRGKEWRAFSVTHAFEVKILWTGTENIFPCSQLKVHILPSQK